MVEKDAGTAPSAAAGDGEAAVLEAIAKMPTEHRATGERLHELVTDSAPGLAPRTWYGMPAYAKDGTVVCFFHAETDYMSFGLTENATLTREEGASHQLIPASWYFATLDDATEDELSDIVREAAG